MINLWGVRVKNVNNLKYVWVVILKENRIEDINFNAINVDYI